MITEESLTPTVLLIKFSHNVTPEEIQLFSNKIVPSPYKTVLIDLSDVYHLNYEVLGKLHMLKLDFSVRHKRLVLQGCSERLYNMLKLLKFDKTFEILRSSPQKHQIDQKQPRKGDTL